ncbi:MAG: efflux RND transporter periplasmic adaptor subunit [Candidatus Eisenbacteria bacterium]|uniref:Efflux RND transporter periplasmic adaptor subunit n=1 Tax=Eiseniibacteriota bacterium TaxID=2212470 RepID=A0A933S9Y2_UNCEI|nr:efflux RND transporter periplasmic adaptor subunit [Candidatus Eisenbacteria bacterium]
MSQRFPSLPFRRPLALLASAALTLAAGGCAEKSAPRAPRSSVTVAPAERRDMPVDLIASGTVDPIESASIGSQVGGMVTRIAFQEGDDVRAGQALVELDARPFRATLAQVTAALARDRAQAAVARAEAARAAQLHAQQLLSQADFDAKQAAAEALAAAVAADSAAVQRAKLDLEYATIRSPIAGRAGEVKVHVGDYVKAATSEPLVTVNHVDPIDVRFTLPEADVAAVRRHRAAGTRVFARLAAGDSTELEGRLVFVDNAVDPATGAFALKGRFANPDGRLWPGAFVEVRLELERQKDVVVVPSVAVSAGQKGTYVYVLGADSTASPRPVKVARSDDEFAVIAEGLQPGEVVITDGQFRLAPGSKVVVRGPASAGAAGGGGKPGEPRGAKR